MLPELPRFLLWLAWTIMDLCDLIYQCLLCQVLILMTLAMVTIQVSPLLHTHLHLHLFRMCNVGGPLYHGRRKQHLMTVLSFNHMRLKVMTHVYQQLHLGWMSCRCHHCGALHWLEECTSMSSKANPHFGQCCNHGKVVLPLLS